MPVLGTPPITATELARRIISESDLTWNWGDRPVKNLLYDLGRSYGLAFCHKKGLAQGVDVQEWMLDLVWMGRTNLTVQLAVESEDEMNWKGRLDDFQKLMVIKSPLKLFIYSTGVTPRSRDVRQDLREYLEKFTQHLEGEEYLLMEVRVGPKERHADFYH
jgi:hypothetical protein